MTENECRYYGTMTLTPCEDKGWEKIEWCFYHEKEIKGKCPEDCPHRIMNKKPVVLAQGVEYYPEDGTLLLLRCPKCGRENYAPAVASGKCVWCGYDGHELIKEGEK